MRHVLLVCLLCITPIAMAQETQTVQNASGAILRALDTMTGQLRDLEISNGETKVFERLKITVDDCRYPTENPYSDAFAYVKIEDIREADVRFEGWMTAASPALSAMDHPRYDVWALRCIIPVAETSDSE